MIDIANDMIHSYTLKLGTREDQVYPHIRIGHKFHCDRLSFSSHGLTGSCTAGSNATQDSEKSMGYTA